MINKIINPGNFLLIFVKDPEDIKVSKISSCNYRITTSLNPINKYIIVQDPNGVNVQILTSNNIDIAKSQIKKNYNLDYIALGDRADLTFEMGEMLVNLYNT